MTVSINKVVSMGVLPGSYPPALAWHRFDIKNDSGLVDHYVDDQLRATIPIEHFVEYIDKNESVAGLVVTDTRFEMQPQHTIKKSVKGYTKRR